MAEVTYFVALPFVAADDGIAAGELCLTLKVIEFAPPNLGQKSLAILGSQKTGARDLAAYRPTRISQHMHQWS
ncbi:hypothetical protein IVA94_39260 [Bradyrhizobium sp. 156]|uniref:hypothetical protein n=1 Tax=Bradyrhizobium sp. 156 TaxID=2782630 RepID=UPI001FF7CA02|nr:hypothetical protein [Bradyrhizobium sp. 156]MCK1326689.1 hypothetical protein [Bradyrhizobium sp. 156]